ncbi:hypothetical protein Barb4_04958 [Bacteroidales bacterium Barb4]|nr:hypothetical protein Barb4_04958 [Bacteroidales bacterium Barb4]
MDAKAELIKKMQAAAAQRAQDGKTATPPTRVVPPSAVPPKPTTPIKHVPQPEPVIVNPIIIGKVENTPIKVKPEFDTTPVAKPAIVQEIIDAQNPTAHPAPVVKPQIIIEETDETAVTGETSDADQIILDSLKTKRAKKANE